jgi:2-keto-4-pentenoate hydratase/2-oxohepta-3-ene-1,7-dioic acid hydratase in catechol pathway
MRGGLGMGFYGHELDSAGDRMGKADDPLFRLATYQSNRGPKVGMVIGAKIFALGDAVGRLETKAAKKLIRSTTFDSMLDILKGWPEYINLLIDAATLLSKDLINCRDAQDISQVTLLAPVPYPGKIINVGLNFYDHAAEMGITIPSEGFQPNFFLKGDYNCVVGPGQKVKLTSAYVDWEAELAVVIGKKAKDVNLQEAMDYVAGYTCHNDVSDRGAMMRKDGSIDFFSGKYRDTFAPLGPYLVPKEFMPDPKNLRIQCLLNGKVMQDFGTDQMIWGPAECVAFASARVTLQPGDIIALGTGAGTGWAKGITIGPAEMPKIIENMYHGGGLFLKSGDRIAVNIEPIGRLENEVGGS